jgi:hypothetical protein
MNTALILRPADAPEIRVLECDGPESIPRVHRYPGHFVGIIPFDEWKAMPEHLKHPAPRVTDYDQACRCARLLQESRQSGTLSAAHLSEILRRLETIHGPLNP